MDTNRVPRRRACASCARLLAADQTWEDCNPARRCRGEKAAGSLDSGKAEKTMIRDGAPASKQALLGSCLHRDREGGG